MCILKNFKVVIKLVALGLPFKILIAAPLADQQAIVIVVSPISK